MADKGCTKTKFLPDSILRALCSCRETAEVVNPEFEMLMTLPAHFAKRLSNG
jgi:hypothetical protein